MQHPDRVAVIDAVVRCVHRHRTGRQTAQLNAFPGSTLPLTDGHIVLDAVVRQDLHGQVHDRVSAVLVGLCQLYIALKRFGIIHSFELHRVTGTGLGGVHTIGVRHCGDVQQQTIDRVTTGCCEQAVRIDIRFVRVRETGDMMSAPIDLFVRYIELLFEQIGRVDGQFQRDDRVPTLRIRNTSRVATGFGQVLEQVVRVRLTATDSHRVLVIGVVLTRRLRHLHRIDGVVMRLRVVSCYHIEIGLVRCGIVSDEHVRTLRIGRHIPFVVRAKRQCHRGLAVAKRERLSLECGTLQAVVIDHLHIVQVDVIHRTVGRCSATRCNIRSEGHQHVCRLIRRDRIIGERCRQTLPSHRRSSRVIDLRIAYLNRRVVTRLRVLVAGVGCDDGMCARFVGRVGRVLVCRDILRPEHQRIGLTRKSGVVAAIGRVGEVIVLGSVGSRGGTGIDLSVGTVTVRLGTQHDVRLQEGAVRTGRTRTNIRALSELMGVAFHKRSERTGRRAERVPSGRFVIGPVALKTAVDKIIVLVRRLCREGERRLREIDPHLLSRHTSHGVGFRSRQEVNEFIRISRAVDGQRAVIDTRLRGTPSLRHNGASQTKYRIDLLHFI